MPVLELVRQALCARLVVVHRRLGAVLAHEVHHDVHVVVAGRRQPVPDRDPPAPNAVVTGGPEAHALDEVGRDPVPLLVRQRALLDAQRQRAVPHVRVPVTDLDLALLLAPLLDRDGHARAEHAPRQVEFVGDVERVVGAQLTPADRVHDDVVPGDDVRVRVLVVPPLPCEVDHHAGDLVAARDVRHHAPTSKRRSAASG